MTYVIFFACLIGCTLHSWHRAEIVGGEKTILALINEGYLVIEEEEIENED